VEGFLVQVLQRRRVVVEGKTVRDRLERPRGCRDIEGFLAPWLK